MRELCVDVGDILPVDTVVAIIGQDGETEFPSPLAVEKQPANGREQPARQYRGRISPVVGRIAAEHAIDLNQVVGSGKDGRITKRDVLAYVDERNQQTPVSALAKEPLREEVAPAPVREEKAAPATGEKRDMAAGDQLLHLDSMRRSIAQHMVHSKQTSPHVTTVFEFDFSAAAAHRKAHKERFLEDGARLTFTV